MRILVGTDFSPAGARATEAALAWARRTASALRIIHVVPPKRWLTGLWHTDLATVSSVHRHAGVALQSLVAALDTRHLELSTGLVAGAASVQIAAAAREFHADLLVIGARGEHEAPGGESGLGATSAKLLAAAAMPLLLVRAAAAGSPHSVLAAVDLSPVSKEVLRWARAGAAAGQPVTVFHAYDAPFAARLQAYGVARESIDLYSSGEQSARERELDALIAASGADGHVTRLIDRGEPIALLLAAVRRLAPDLLVLGKHGDRVRPRAPLGSGSVSRHLALHAPTSVLIVPPSRHGNDRPGQGGLT